MFPAFAASVKICRKIPGQGPLLLLLRCVYAVYSLAMKSAHYNDNNGNNNSCNCGSNFNAIVNALLGSSGS